MTKNWRIIFWIMSNEYFCMVKTNKVTLNIMINTNFPIDSIPYYNLHTVLYYFTAFWPTLPTIWFLRQREVKLLNAPLGTIELNIHLRIFISTRPTGVHLNIRAGSTIAVLVWTVPPIYNYWSGIGVCLKTIILWTTTFSEN